MRGKVVSMGGLMPGEEVTLEVEEGIYRGTYVVSVLGISAYELSLQMPVMSGRLVPVRVGAFVTICPGKGKDCYRAEVLERRFRPLPTLVVSRPYAISRASGRKPLVGMRVITITGGKGGVGKTNIAVNLAFLLAKMGQDVVLFDGDLGLANVDILLGCRLNLHLGQVITGQIPLSTALQGTPYGFRILSGGSGLQELANLSDWQLSHLVREFNSLAQEAKLLLIDTGAGLGREVWSFLAAADEVIVVTTPEPTALTDAYAIFKLLARQEGEWRLRLIVNRVGSLQEGKEVAALLERTVKRFLGQGFDFLGCVREDPYLPRAVRQQRPVSYIYPRSPAAQDLYAIVLRLLKVRGQEAPPKRGFWQRFFQFMRNGREKPWRNCSR